LPALLLTDINLGFLTEGKLAAILITPSSWGSQQAGHSPRIKLIFWRRCRGLEEEEAPTSTTFSHVNYAPAANFLVPLPGKSGRPLQGEFFAHTSFTLLLFCFTLFILPASFYIKNPKKLESLVVVISLLLVHHAVP
jgi:hypothetical protein